MDLVSERWYAANIFIISQEIGGCRSCTCIFFDISYTLQDSRVYFPLSLSVTLGNVNPIFWNTPCTDVHSGKEQDPEHGYSIVPEGGTLPAMGHTGTFHTHLLDETMQEHLPKYKLSLIFLLELCAFMKITHITPAFSVIQLSANIFPALMVIIVPIPWVNS